MNVAFVDTETTGLDPERNPIWEIAVIIPDGPDHGEHVWQQRLPLQPNKATPTPPRPSPSPPAAPGVALRPTAAGSRSTSSPARRSPSE